MVGGVYGHAPDTATFLSVPCGSPTPVLPTSGVTNSYFCVLNCQALPLYIISLPVSMFEFIGDNRPLLFFVAVLRRPMVYAEPGSILAALASSLDRQNTLVLIEALA